MLEHWGQIAGLGALGVFVASVIGMRVVSGPATPVRGVGRRAESSVDATSPAGRVQVATGADRPSPGAGVGAATVTDCFLVARADTPAGSRPARADAPGASKDDPPYRIEMNAHSHAVEFVRWMRDMGLAGRYAAAEIAKYYDWFTRDQRVFPIPATKFLEALNKHPGVGKKRDRLKDEHGRVPKLASGSPMRTMFYTIGEEPAVHVPSGVAAIDSAARSRPMAAGCHGHTSAAGRSRPRAEGAARRPAARMAVAAHDQDDIVAGHEIELRNVA